MVKRSRLARAQIYCSRPCLRLALQRKRIARLAVERRAARAEEMARRAQERRPCAAPTCTETFAPTNPRRRYCSDACGSRQWRDSNRRYTTKRKLAYRRAVLGRKCRWPHCQVTDAEQPFSTLSECLACAKQRTRPRGKCGRCGGPKKPYGCPTCDRPTGMLRVVLLDASSDRERTVYRAIHSGWASCAGRRFRVRPGQVDKVLTLPTKLWSSVRL